MENTVKTTASRLIRWAGLASMVAGFLFVIMQAIHPVDVLASVTTARWAIVHYLGVVMGLLGMLGILGIYTRQVEESGWLGLAGFLLFGVFFALTMAFQFIEAFVSPVLAAEAPKFVEGILAMVSGHASEANLGAIPTVYGLTGLVGYMLGGLLFGIATFRAGVLPRWAGGLLAIGVLLPLVGTALVSHPYDRIFALPVGSALAWLGYALWSRRQGQSLKPLFGNGSPQFVRTKAK